MRTNHLRAPKALHLAAGAFVLAAPATAVALGAGQAQGAPSGPALHATVSRHSLGYGKPVTVQGTAPLADSGSSVQLQFEPAGSGSWSALQRSTIGSAGHFSFRANLRRSGQLRVVGLTAAPSATNPVAVAAGATSPPPAASAPQRVRVAAALRVRPRSNDVAAGHRVSVRGHLLPDQAGRRVRLLAHSSHGWVTIAHTRTGRHGQFDLRYVVRATGTRRLRVRFGGDTANRATWARAGEVTGLVARLASWYSDGGSTACGFHAYYGVANLSLPCGAHVAFKYGGRSVVATVDDRGPYVGGRSYDLNQNVAQRLGMYGVATVLASR